MPEDQQAVLHIYATTVKTTVIKRDADLVTKEEEATHWKELQAAVLDELKICSKKVYVILWTLGMLTNGSSCTPC